MKLIQDGKIDMNWKLKISFSGQEEHALLYRSEYKGLGIQMEIITSKYRSRKYGKSKTSYFIDGDKRRFDSKTEFIEALKVCALERSDR